MRVGLPPLLEASTEKGVPEASCSVGSRDRGGNPSTARREPNGPARKSRDPSSRPTSSAALREANACSLDPDPVRGRPGAIPTSLRLVPSRLSRKVEAVSQWRVRNQVSGGMLPSSTARFRANTSPSLRPQLRSLPETVHTIGEKSPTGRAAVLTTMAELRGQVGRYQPKRHVLLTRAVETSRVRTNRERMWRIRGPTAPDRARTELTPGT